MITVEQVRALNWVHAWTAALDEPEMRELVMDAWRMVVPKKVAAARLGEP